MRSDGRRLDELRPIQIVTGVQRDPYGSVQIAFGNTRVLVAATVSTRLPEWLMGKGRGWITAEYSMLPGSTPGRVARIQKGRAEEIQRLIGRSLRAAVDLKALGERVITVDCDVIQADAGTRTAAVTGGYVAVELAVRRLMAEGALATSPVRRQVCAVSCVVVAGEPRLDPDYQEDRDAEVDMNFVFTEDGRFIEVQGTAENEPFGQEALDSLVALARKGAHELFTAQKTALR